MRRVTLSLPGGQRLTMVADEASAYVSGYRAALVRQADMLMDAAEATDAVLQRILAEKGSMLAAPTQQPTITLSSDGRLRAVMAVNSGRVTYRESAGSILSTERCVSVAEWDEIIAGDMPIK